MTDGWRMARSRVWGVLFGGLFLFGASQAGATPVRMEDCFSYETPTINVIPFMDTPRINTQVALANIRNVYGFSKKEPMVRSNATLREVPVGVTAANLEIESNLEITTRTPSDEGLACAQISGIDFRFGFSDTIIYIARELPVGSCGYHAVLEHEFKHVETDRLFLNEVTSLVARDLAVTLRKIGRVRGSSAEIAKKHLQKSLDDYTNRLSGLLAQMREQRQKEVDTPQEYERISASCNGEIRRMVSAHVP